jgi:hypothetical protein
MTATTYVLTRDAKAAVDGHETEILGTLGIDWRKGRPHIPCPYPHHDDSNPSWRWDEKHARAHCTCTKADTIFNVLMKINGIGFDVAKLKVVELLGRWDLVRERSEKRFHATDAESLLNPPFQHRDDALPAEYLGHRLNLPPEAVLMPATPAIGWRALGYFDAPPPGTGRGRPAKPVHVGDFPCAVFGTVDADGKRHAHRIYVAPGGAGKADLGIGPNEQPRDPKKSARVTDGQSTAGRSVVWGDASKAPTVVLCEGIETASAVMVAFRSEVEAGKLAVAAAISATGLEAFCPWPATRTIVVCGDRDEAAKPSGKPGSRRGETAARTLALKLHRTHSILIALPGISGETVDWLDIHLRDGMEAVRAGISSAAAFTPTIAEQQQVTANSDRQTALRKVAETYPLPQLETLTLAYMHAQDGTVKVHKRSGGSDPGSETWVPIATPFGVPARLRYADQADAYGLRVVVEDMDRHPRELDFDRASLAKMGGADIRSLLFRAGLRTELDGEMIAIQCLKGANPGAEIVVVHQPGWHAQPDHALFVCPDGTVIGAAEAVTLELARSERMAAEVARAGDLSGWRNASAAALTTDGVPHWTLGVIAAFAGPILSLTGLDTCGINLSGMSSAGKSTAQRLAASAWSTPDIRKPGLCQSARATDNAVEALAFRATGTVLSLDELGHVSGKTAARMIYTIAGGVGKKRMTADAVVRDGFSWSTFAILSGECSLAEKIQADGGEWLAGMAVRIVDVDVTEINRQVDQHVLRQIAHIEAHHGHAGPAFVKAFIEAGYHREAIALRAEILAKAQRLAGDGADSARIRAATPFALLQMAGDLAAEFNLIPETTDIDGAVAWGWQRFCQSSDAIALEPEAQAIANIRAWIAERWNVTIKPLDFDGGINNRETLAWYDDTTIYLPRARLREAAASVLKESAVAQALDRQGMLEGKEDQYRRYRRYVPKMGKVEAYALKRSEFGRTNQLKDKPDLRVYDGGLLDAE